MFEQKPKRSLYAFDFAALTEIVTALGQPKFRAKQIWDFLYNKRIADIGEMHNLPNALIADLREKYVLFDLKIVKQLTSKDGNTWKYLLETRDGYLIECVLLKYAHGYTLCVSSQVGCAMGCTFCASTIDGLARHLAAYEMWQQILLVNYDKNIRIARVVMMGSGEPLHNYAASVEFIKAVSDPKRIGLSQRHITLSTCGIVDRIYDLAAEKLQITLAVSLHSPFDDERSEIVPINRRAPIGELMRAIDHYFATTGRRVTIEYALIKGKNDTPAHANALVDHLIGKPIHVNLIPINPIAERSYRAPDKQYLTAFKKRLETAGIETTQRREMGDDIEGACGQLRRSAKNQMLNNKGF